MHKTFFSSIKYIATGVYATAYKRKSQLSYDYLHAELMKNIMTNAVGACKYSFVCKPILAERAPSRSKHFWATSGHGLGRQCRIFAQKSNVKCINFFSKVLIECRCVTCCLAIGYQTLCQYVLILINQSINSFHKRKTATKTLFLTPQRIWTVQEQDLVLSKLT